MPNKMPATFKLGQKIKYDRPNLIGLGPTSLDSVKNHD